MTRHAITIAVLAAACAFYILGFTKSAGLLIGLGVLAEGVFWWRLYVDWKKRI